MSSGKTCTPEEYERERKSAQRRKKRRLGVIAVVCALFGFYALLIGINAFFTSLTTEFPSAEAGSVSGDAKRLYHTVMDSEAEYQRMRFLGFPDFERENMTAAHVVAYFDERFDGVGQEQASEAIEVTLILQQWDVDDIEAIDRLADATRWWWWLDTEEVPSLLRAAEASAEQVDLMPMDVLAGLAEHGAEWINVVGSEAEDNYSGITTFASERQAMDAAAWGAVDCEATHNTAHPACLEAPECWHEVASLLASTHMGVGDVVVSDITPDEGRSLAQIEAAAKRYSDCSRQSSGAVGTAEE